MCPPIFKFVDIFTKELTHHQDEFCTSKLLLLDGACVMISCKTMNCWKKNETFKEKKKKKKEKGDLSSKARENNVVDENYANWERGSCR